MAKSDPLEIKLGKAIFYVTCAVSLWFFLLVCRHTVSLLKKGTEGEEFICKPFCTSLFRS